jgi:hypothetical protein
MKQLPVASYQLPVQDKNALLRHDVLALLLVCFIILAACIPAKVPSNLDDTPGPAVVVTDKTFENSAFTARYPDGWRIVTGEAQAAPSVTFVAPDEQSTIQLIVGTLDNASFNNPDVQTDIRSLTIDDLQITAVLSAPPDRWDEMVTQFERVLSSIKPV